MLIDTSNGRRRLQRPWKRLLDEAETGLLWSQLVSDDDYYYYYVDEGNDDSEKLTE